MVGSDTFSNDARSNDAVSNGSSSNGPFSNEVLGRRDLPRLVDARFEALDPAFLRVRTATAALATVLSAVAAGAVIGADPSRPVVAMAAVAVALVLGVGLLRVLAARRMGYLVREHDLSFRSGVVGRSVATVPFARVQHVAVRRGPIDRSFGLASLQVRTAGGFVAVSGLDAELAGRLKQLVADRAGALAELEGDDELGDREAAPNSSDDRDGTVVPAPGDDIATRPAWPPPADDDGGAV